VLPWYVIRSVNLPHQLSTKESFLFCWPVKYNLGLKTDWGYWNVQCLSVDRPTFIRWLFDWHQGLGAPLVYPSWSPGWISHGRTVVDRPENTTSNRFLASMCVLIYKETCFTKVLPSNGCVL
jgi:hypothetical protein